MWVENGLDATSKDNKMGVPYRKKISRIHRPRRGVWPQINGRDSPSYVHIRGYN